MSQTNGYNVIAWESEPFPLNAAWKLRLVLEVYGWVRCDMERGQHNYMPSLQYLCAFALEDTLPDSMLFLFHMSFFVPQGIPQPVIVRPPLCCRGVPMWDGFQADTLFSP